MVSAGRAIDFRRSSEFGVDDDQRFRQQAQQDFSDFAMIGDAEAELVDGILTLRIDLRPRNPSGDKGATD